MSYTHQIIFSLLCIVSTAAPTDNNRRNAPTKKTPLYEPERELSDDINKELLKQRLEITEKTNIFSEEDIEEMELAFESSPEQAQAIVKYLQDPDYFPGNVDYRYTIFFGDSKSNNKLTAKAIAYKMTQDGWDYKFLSSTSLLGRNSHHTAIKLRDELESIAISKKPTILVFYELNQLLEYNGNKYNDADLTDAVLWNFIDNQKRNNNFFFIGTMDRVHKLTKRTKSRIIMDIIEFPSNL